MFGTMTKVEARTEAEIGLSGLCSATFGVLSLMTLACSHMNDWAFFYNDPSKSTFCAGNCLEPNIVLYSEKC